MWNLTLFSLFTSPLVLFELHTVDLFISSYLVPSFVVKPSFVEDIKMAAGFSDVRQCVGWLIFMYKVTSKIRLNLLLGAGGGFMKNVAVKFSVPKLIYERPLTQKRLSILWKAICFSKFIYPFFLQVLI